MTDTHPTIPAVTEADHRRALALLDAYWSGRGDDPGFAVRTDQLVGVFAALAGVIDAFCAAVGLSREQFLPALSESADRAVILAAFEAQLADGGAPPTEPADDPA